MRIHLSGRAWLTVACILCASSLQAEGQPKLIAGIDPKPTDAPPPLEVRRSIQIERTDAPPRLDGKLNDACWRNAPLTGDLRVKAGGKYPSAFPKKTTVRIAYDDTNLYLAFEAFDPDIKNILAKYTARDDRYWLDDDIEFMLDANYGRRSFHQFLFNSAGGRGDYRCRRERGRTTADSKYSPEWQLKTRVYEDRWVAELAMPYRILGLPGVPPDGARWGFNFCRIENPGGILGNWTRALDHRDPRLFGDLKFGRAPYELGSVDLGARARGVNRLRATVRNNTGAPKSLGVSAMVAVDGRTVGRSSATAVTPAGEARALYLNCELPETTAKAVVAVEMFDPEWHRIIATRDYQLTTQPILSARMDSVEYFQADRVARVHVEIHTGDVTAATGSLRVALFAKGQKAALAAGRVSPVPAGGNVLRLNVGGLKAGAYEARITVADADRRTLAEKRLEFSRSKSLLDF